MIGEKIEVNGRTYIVVAEFDNKLYLFDEEVAQTRQVNEHEMFLTIELSDLDMEME